MTCLVLKELPFAKVGEEVEIKDSMFSLAEGVEIWKPNGRITLWPSRWGDPFKDGWLAEKKPTRWSPLPDQEYFFVNTMLTVSMLKFNPEHHDCVARRDMGNCFETEYTANELALRLRDCAFAYRMELEFTSVGRKADFDCNDWKTCEKPDCMFLHKNIKTFCHHSWSGGGICDRCAD